MIKAGGEYHIVILYGQKIESTSHWCSAARTKIGLPHNLLKIEYD